MSNFNVTLETIFSSISHPNADRLSICKLEGIDYQFITGKDEYKKGDKVYYFPIDSILPETLLVQLSLFGKLGGNLKNRVKTVKLRGEISQGIVVPYSTIQKYIDNCGLRLLSESTQNLASVLGVIKYDPELESSSCGVRGNHVRVKTLPEMVHYYDIENCERNKKDVEILMNQLVMVTEKLEGSNFSCGCQKKIIDGVLQNYFYVCSHNKNIELIENDPLSNHPFWKIAQDQGLLNFSKKLLDYYSKLYPREGDFVTIYGEFCGPDVQKNIYKLLEPKVFLFDILYNHRWIDSSEFLSQCSIEGINTVPILIHKAPLGDFLQGKSLQEASNGKSVLYDTLREGVVIKPLLEQYSEHLHGRLILKQRSPEYLSKEK